MYGATLACTFKATLRRMSQAIFYNNISDILVHFNKTAKQIAVKYKRKAPSGALEFKYIIRNDGT